MFNFKRLLSSLYRAHNCLFLNCEEIPRTKVSENVSCFLWFRFSSDASCYLLSLWIPQGHLHIAQVPQGEQVQITQDSEVSRRRQHCPSPALEPQAPCTLVFVRWGRQRGVPRPHGCPTLITWLISLGTNSRFCLSPCPCSTVSLSVQPIWLPL